MWLCDFGYTNHVILVIVTWALGIPSNPRSMNHEHMQDNLNALDFTLSSDDMSALSSDDMSALSSMPQNYCKDDNWYECAP